MIVLRAEALDDIVAIVAEQQTVVEASATTHIQADEIEYAAKTQKTFDSILFPEEAEPSAQDPLHARVRQSTGSLRQRRHCFLKV